MLGYTLLNDVTVRDLQKKGAKAIVLDVRNNTGGFLREAESGLPVAELCRRHGFSEASYYLWRNKFGGMSVSDAKRLKGSAPDAAPVPPRKYADHTLQRVARSRLRSPARAYRAS